MLIFFSLIVFLFFLSEFLERLDRHDKSALESFKHIAAVLAFVFVLYFGYSWAAKNILDDALLLPLSSSSFNG
jgi:TRAP-type C4-dicarboxylate transport system permease small subunit